MKWLALAIFVLAAGAAIYVLNQGQPPTSAKNDRPRDAQAFLEDTTESPSHTIPKATSPDVALPLGVDAKGADAKLSDKKSANPVQGPEAFAGGANGDKDSGDSAADRAARRRRRRMEETSTSDDTSGSAPSSQVSDTSASSSQGYVTASASAPVRASAAPSVNAPASSSGSSANTAGSGANGVTLGGALISGGFITTPAGAAAPSAAASKPATNATPTATPNAAANANNKAPMRMLPIADATKTPATVGPVANADFKKLSPMNPPLMAIKRPLDLGETNGSVMADKYLPPSDTPPADFVGIYASPKSVTLPAAGTAETEKKAIAVTSQKSGFTPQDKPSVELSRDCEATVAAACDANIPDGGPSVLGYSSGNAFMKEDLLPDTKAFDIGTTTVSTTKDPETGKEISTAEISVQIDPGKIPGRYTVRVSLGTQKIYATSFEVLAAASPSIQSFGAAVAEPLSTLGNTTKAPKTQTPP